MWTDDCLGHSHWKGQNAQWSRTLWSCGLIRHVLDREVGGSNIAAAKFWVKNETTVWKRKIGWKMKQRSGKERLWEKWIQKHSTSIWVQTQKNIIFIILLQFSYFFLHFLAFRHEKCLKSILWTAFGVCSSQPLVKICNKFCPKKFTYRTSVQMMLILHFLSWARAMTVFWSWTSSSPPSSVKAIKSLYGGALERQV